MVKLLNLPEPMRNIRQFELFDDFNSFTDTQVWTAVDADINGSVSHDADGENGIVVLNATTTDNEEAYLHSTTELFQFQADRAMEAIARVNITDGGTNTINVAFGWADAIAANAIIDDGGMKASYSGAVIFTEDGVTTWKCESAIATTKTTTVSNLAVAESRWITLRIVAEPVSSTSIEITYFIDNSANSGTNVSGGQAWEQLKDSNSELIKHSVDPTSAVQMQLFAGIKAGDATTNSFQVDYMGGWQLR